MRYVDSVPESNGEDNLATWLGENLVTASTLTMRTGFPAAAAIAAIEDDLTKVLSLSGTVSVVVGGDIADCDTAALHKLLQLRRRFPDQVHIWVVIGPVLQNAQTFHVAHRDATASAWVGSANLTLEGLALNLEAAITLTSGHDDADLVEQIRGGALAAAERPEALLLDQDLLDRLELRVEEARLPFGRTALGPTYRLEPETIMAVMGEIAHYGLDELVISTGFTGLDTLLDGGLRPGTLTVIGSRPGAGRSTLALNILTHTTIERGYPASLYTFESDEHETHLRILCSRSAVPHSTLRTTRFSPEEGRRLVTQFEASRDAPLYINTGAGPHLEALCAAITADAARHALALVVIDTLTMIVGRTFADSREQEIAEIARRLKALAIELDLPILATAELDRSSDRPPHLSDLREGSGIANAADVVALLNPVEEAEHAGPAEVELIVAKNRNGRRGTLTFHLRGDLACFEENHVVPSPFVESR